jgi:bifunctional non-homologous end joining protein LigD
VPPTTDQLSMRLEPPLPKLPAGLRPMLARPSPAPFDSEAHLFEPMWGGARALALIGPADAPGGGEVALVAEDGTQGPAPLDLAGLAMRVLARSAVLDGEIVVVDTDGRLDRDELARRLSGAAGRPLSYLAFDLLHLDGRSLLGLALDRRRQLLRQVLRPGDEAVAVPAINVEGRALFEAVSGQGLYGIRARQRASPYLPGVRSRLWRSVAVEGASAPDAVAGTRPPGAEVGPLGEPLEVEGVAGRRSEPVLALIRRLPLEFEEGPEAG